MVYDVDIVRVPEQTLVSLRERGPVADIGARMARLRALAGQAGLTPAGPMMGRFYEVDMAGSDVDFEVCLPVQASEDGSIPDVVGEARGELVPAHHALATTHVGRRDQMDDAVAALREALEAVGYRACGPLTEVYVTTRGTTPDPARHVTELRLPYAR
jgi:effector-binding domain-containing protein